MEEGRRLSQERLIEEKDRTEVVGLKGAEGRNAVGDDNPGQLTSHAGSASPEHFSSSMSGATEVEAEVQEVPSSEKGDRTQVKGCDEGSKKSFTSSPLQKLSCGSTSEPRTFSEGLQSTPVKAVPGEAGPTGSTFAGFIAPDTAVAERLKKVSQQSCALEGFTLGECGAPLLQKILEGLPFRSQRTGRVDRTAFFPLPTSRDLFATLDPNLDDRTCSWMVCVCISLNSFWDCEFFCDSIRNDGQRECLNSKTSERCETNLCYLDSERLDWNEMMKTKSIDYKGDEVKVARWFEWSNIQPALPAEVGLVPLADVCDRGCKGYVLHFDDYLKPQSEWISFKPLRVMVSDHDWGEVCDGLVQQGVCTYIREEAPCSMASLGSARRSGRRPELRCTGSL